MEKVAIFLRFLQLYSHICHNLVKGCTFFQDHEFFGELYPAYEVEYDNVVERMIGLGKHTDLFSINREASEMLGRVEFQDACQAFKVLLRTEGLLCSEIESTVTPRPMEHPHGDLLQGTIQMLGNIADASEVRQYKMKQRTSE